MAKSNFSPKILKDFRTFALHGNAIDLAIGVAIGAAFTAVVTAIVTDIITPIIGAIFKVNFATLTFTIHGSTFSYGLVVNAFVSFVAIAFVLFFIVVVPMNALKKRFRPDADATPTMAACPACLTSIPIGARRCSACTEQLADGWSNPAPASA